MGLELRQVSKRYPNGAIGARNFDLAVEAGQFVSLFGPWGSGKTSQLHMPGLLQQPDSGGSVDRWQTGGWSVRG